MLPVHGTSGETQDDPLFPQRHTHDLACHNLGVLTPIRLGSINNDPPEVGLRWDRNNRWRYPSSMAPPMYMGSWRVARVSDSSRAEQRLIEQENRDAALCFPWSMRKHYPAIKKEFGVDETGAAIALSLAMERSGAGRYTSYSRHAAHYTVPKRYANPLYTRRRVLGQVDRLESLGLIDNIVACPQRPVPGQKGFQSIMRARVPLVDVVNDVIASVGPLVIAAPKEPLILRDVDKRPIDYTETRDRKRMRDFVFKMNEAVRGSIITGCPPAPLVRVFNETFARGGRFYAVGGSWQSMNEEMRSTITIAGEPVAEIDFKTMHPAILYSMEGRPLPDDCYTLDGWPSEARGFIKYALLVILNSASPQEARAAIANDTKKGRLDVLAIPGSKGAFQVAKDVMAHLSAAHGPISRHFYSNRAGEMMKVDSAIAELVMKMMLQGGVVVLPIHDSFLVQRSRADDLEEVMRNAAYQMGVVIRTERCDA